MARDKKAKKVRVAPDEALEPSFQPEGRADQLVRKEAVREALLKIFTDVTQGFYKQADRADDTKDWWDVYNCVLGQKQAYNGNAQIFIPIVHSAVEARKTRFVNQVFPKNGRYIEAVSEDGTIPHAETALLEHYVRKAKLRTQVAPALCKNGDIEGQMTVQVTWQEFRRHVVHRVKRGGSQSPLQGSQGPVGMPGQPPMGSGPGASMGGMQGLSQAYTEADDIDESFDDIQEEELVEGRPVVKVIPDSDLLVLPPTVDSLEEALRSGGSVTTICRWSESMIEEMIATEEIDPEIGEALKERLIDEQTLKEHQRQDKAKEMVDAAGIKSGARGKYALVYRTWVMLNIDGERRLCLAYYGGENLILGCKRNPYWSDHIDIISSPVDKVDGSFKGRSKLEFGVADLQYHANDVTNQGADSATYALLPIVMTDPEKNPNVGEFVLTLAAVWKTDPTSTQFAKFPEIWKDALELVAADQQAIFQALSVNPAQITQGMTPKKKPSQAEIANEQQVDILTTADAVTVMEDEIFTPIVLFMLELDHQYRDKALRVRQYGPTGMMMNMIEIPLIQMDKTYQFRWFGVEQARNAQTLQQQVAGINVLRGVPPPLIQGYRLDLGPLLSHMVDNLFGPRLGATILKDIRQELTIDPEFENQMLLNGHVVPVHPMDNLQQHMQAHMQAGQQSGDPHGTIRAHMAAHMQAFQFAQNQAMMQQMQQQGPPKGGQGPGASRGARMGAQPTAPRGGQNPPGTIAQDQLKDPMRMPR